MAHLIDKAALVAEIERRITEGEKVVKEVPSSGIFGLIQAYKNTLSFLDTLEVKEVDYAPIDNDFERDAVSFCIDKGLNTTPYIAKTIAKHFFNLGLKYNNTENDAQEI